MNMYEYSINIKKKIKTTESNKEVTYLDHLYNCIERLSLYCFVLLHVNSVLLNLVSFNNNNNYKINIIILTHLVSLK